jgi:hypothetical protein
VALVRGRRGWRLAGGSSIQGAAGDARGIAAFARISELVLRLIQGEEKNEYLFAVLAQAHGALMSPSCEAWPTIEIVCVARVLYTLGYLSVEALESTLFTHTAYALPHLEEAEVLRDRLLSSINKAIAETQL